VLFPKSLTLINLFIFSFPLQLEQAHNAATVDDEPHLLGLQRFFYRALFGTTISTYPRNFQNQPPDIFVLKRMHTVFALRWFLVRWS